MNTEVLIAPTFASAHSVADLPERWSCERANDWYARRPWIVGCNYIPSTASNQLEMWQAETFDPHRIDVELGWAENLGFNAVRVFLHDLVWEQDAVGYAARIDQFLCIAAKHGIDTLFVIFDSCWNPAPHLGQQEPPVSGIHNSRWVQSPGSTGLSSVEDRLRLQNYVTDLLSNFREDPRVLGWDLWNEPDNDNAASYPDSESPNKLVLVGDLLPQVFEWARSAHPSQPLTSGIWFGDWSTPAGLTRIQRTQMEKSDIISFHNYEDGAQFSKRIAWLQSTERPLLCTEYMARSLGSTFQEILPIAKANRVAAFNWGFVAGKTQTRLPWSSWQANHNDGQEFEWFHEILREDGSSYSETETETIRCLVQGEPTPGYDSPKPLDAESVWSSK